MEALELKPREYAIMEKMRALCAESHDGVSEDEIWAAVKDDEAFAGTRQGDTEIPVEGELLLEGLARILMNLARQAAKQEWERMSDAPYEVDELMGAIGRCVDGGMPPADLLDAVQHGLGRVGVDVEFRRREA